MATMKRLFVSPSQICSSCHRSFSTTSRAQHPPRNPMSPQDLLQTLGRMGKRNEPEKQASILPNRNPPMPTATATRSQPDSTASSIKAALQRSARPFGLQDPGNRAVRSRSLAAESAERLAQDQHRAAMEFQVGRKWRAGDVYAPNDLGPREGRKWNMLQRKPSRDVFEMIGQDPRKFYKNMPLLAEFVTETGKIRHSDQTGLKPKNQRRLAKAIRRAIGCGLMPSVHRHPEVMARELEIEKYRKPRMRID